MSRLDEWLGESARLRTWVGDKGRPASVGNIILDKPTTIRILRAGTYLDEQVVRFDTLGNVNIRDFHDDTGIISSQQMILIGYKGHPTETDTNIQTQDRFSVGDRSYRVTKVQAGHANHLLAFVEEYNG